MKSATLLVVVLAVLVAGCGSSGTSSSSSSVTSTSTTSGPSTNSGTSASPESSAESGPTPAAGAPAKKGSYLQQFQAVNDRFEGSPQIGELNQALAAATGSEAAQNLTAAEAPLQSYLHRLDTYIAELRGLHFPACARQFQGQIVKFESEGRTAVAKILPLLQAGNVTKVIAYIREAAPILAAKLGQVEAKEQSLENGGNDGC